MPVKQIFSPNVNSIDFSAAYNLGLRNVTLGDLSSYKTGGAANVQGINFTIISPSGITLWNNQNYGASSDIIPATPLPFVKPLAYFRSAIEYGVYSITMNLKDADGTIYSLTKTANICQPAQCPDVQGANGCANINVEIICNDNNILITDNTNYVYSTNNLSPSTLTRSITVIDPNGTKNPIAIPYFILTPIYGGKYQVNVSNTAVYDYGDSQTVTVMFIRSATYTADCSLDLCGIFCALDSIIAQYDAVKGTGSPKEKTLQSNLARLSYIIPLTQIGVSCGRDVSDYIDEIQQLTGLECVTNCGSQNVCAPASIGSDQTIIIQPAAGSSITVAQQTQGNITYFTIGDKVYQFAIDANSANYLAVTTTTSGNVVTATFSFKPSGINNVYSSDTTQSINQTNSLETLKAQTIVAGTMATDGTEINIEAYITSVTGVIFRSAFASGTQYLLQFNGLNLMLLTLGTNTYTDMKITARIIRTSSSTAFCEGYVELYGGLIPLALQSKQITIIDSNLINSIDWDSNNYDITLKTLQLTSMVVAADFLTIKVFRK